MQLVVYAFCGLHSLNVLLLPGYMVSIRAYTCLFQAVRLVREFNGKTSFARNVHSGMPLEGRTDNPAESTRWKHMWL